VAKHKHIEILFNQWKSNRLSHFYILEAHSSVIEKQAFLRKTIDDFLLRVIATEKNIAPDNAQNVLEQGHADILTIQKSDKGSEFTVKSGDFDPFFNFLGFKNLEFKQRFLIVEQAHLIGKTISNKLLKSLEEPTPNTTILFLADSTAHMLDTINSRAIKWTLREQDTQLDGFSNNETRKQVIEKLSGGNSTSSLVANYLEGQINEHELIDRFKSKTDFEECFKTIINTLSDTRSHTIIKSELLEQMNWWTKAREFHNSPQESLVKLLNSLNKL